MTNEIVEAQSPLQKEKLLEFLSIAGIAQKLTDKEKMQFVEIAQAYCLNPFKREIYCTTYGTGEYRTTSIITGYEVYIKRAERTGKLNGWNVKIEGTGEDMRAIITINRKDWSEPFTHEVYFVECANRKKDGTLNSMWSKMPRFMTKKVAIAQGFRLCFSDELGGMPYTADELPENEKPTEKAAPAKQITAQHIAPKAADKNTLDRIYGAKSVAELKKIYDEIIADAGDARQDVLAMYEASFTARKQAILKGGQK